jgi:hypothetical protein
MIRGRFRMIGSRNNKIRSRFRVAISRSGFGVSISRCGVTVRWGSGHKHGLICPGSWGWGSIGSRSVVWSGSGFCRCKGLLRDFFRIPLMYHMWVEVCTWE